MKVITANRLEDGAVVFFGDDDTWTARLEGAASFDKEDANDALAAVKLRVSEIADAYLIDVDDDGALTGRETLRETIRTSGPTIRVDLGYQASVA